MKLWPGLNLDTKIYYNVFQLGFNKKINNALTPAAEKNSGIFIPDSVSMAFSYYHTEFDYGRVSNNPIDPKILSSSRAYDKADNFTVSVSADYFVEVGAGITYKRLKSFTPGEYDPYNDTRDKDFSGSGNAYDFGLLCRLPVMQKINYESMIKGYLKPVLDLSAGVSWNNRGDDITWSDSSSDPLPRFRRTGVACSIGLNYEKILNLNIFMVTTAFDRYTPRIKGTQTTKEDSDTMKGFELSLLETVSIRSGEYDTSFKTQTRGYTFKSDGISKLIFILNQGTSSDKTIDFILTHLSLSFSKFESDGNAADRSHSQMTIKF